MHRFFGRKERGLRMTKTVLIQKERGLRMTKRFSVRKNAASE